MPAPEPQKPHEARAPHHPSKNPHGHTSHTPRVALVTGAARGIGAATVATLAQAGWRVLAVDRATDDPNLPYKLGTRTELEQVATDAGPNVITAQADVRDVEALARAVAAAEDRWGHLDAALAVAGVIAGGVPSWEMPAGQEQAVLDIDLGGVINLARVAVPALLRHPEPRQGRFLAVASAAATRGLPMLAAYCAAKSGVAGFIRALGAELRRQRRHRQRGQPRLDRHPDPGRERPALPSAVQGDVRRPAAPGPPARPGRGRGGAGLPGRGRRQRHDRRRHPGRRGTGPLTQVR